jgi:class 3 adenylate cyclase
MSPGEPARPLFVVCEDGTEYIHRFQRFLGESFDFVAARDFATARAVLVGADGLLLDLDFRRTPPERLIDEQGRSAAAVDAGTRARLAETQGILILRRLRAEGVATPAILFADIDDARQAAFLQQTLPPLTLAPSRLGLRELAALLRGH